MILVRVSDVRQFAFCPRVIWHRGMLGQSPSETPKMELGKLAEAVLTKLEKRRGLRRYRLKHASRRFQVQLESTVLGICGVCDLVLEVAEMVAPWPEAGSGTPLGLRQISRVIPAASYPVEVKTTQGGVGRHHILQLAGYALLLSEVTGQRVDTGFILLLPEDRIVSVAITDSERDEFMSIVRSIRDMLENERFPGPTRHVSFCPDCEHVNFCGDVL